MIFSLDAVSAKNNVIIAFPDSEIYVLERNRIGSAWITIADAASFRYTDYDVEDGVYQYRASLPTSPSVYLYSNCVRCGVGDPYGYTFGNYRAPEGTWGEVVTVDDMRYTYLWGVDFRASNGQPYTDAQIQFHIDSSVCEMERRLNITIKKTKIVTDAERRGVKNYDVDEGLYTFRREKIQRNGMISTRRRPVLSVDRLSLLSRNSEVYDMGREFALDKTKGMIRFFNRPLNEGDQARAVMNSVFPYGAEQFGNNLFYIVDYTAGYENSDKVPADLRSAIGKMCAIEMLNIIGDGLMAGFSSSSLSMDGMSESFSSTQSATSATYGARIKEYGEELASYIKDNKMKFGHIHIGAL